MLRRLLALLVMGAAVALPAAVVSPASAASGACPRGTGVTVVVNSQVRCDPSPGGFARESFADAGFSLEDLPDQPGAVCRIDGFPGDGRCFETDAYWGLFVSDGASGSWRYASVGVNGQRVSAGSWVAFVWQGSASRKAPSQTPLGPVPAAPAPGDGSGTSSGGGSGGSGGGGGGASSAPDPSATPATPTPTPTPSESVPPTDAPADGVGAGDADERRNTSAEVEDTGGGGPWGILLAVLAIAGLGGAAVVAQRRRSAGG